MCNLDGDGLIDLSVSENRFQLSPCRSFGCEDTGALMNLTFLTAAGKGAAISWMYSRQRHLFKFICSFQIKVIR